VIEEKNVTAIQENEAVGNVSVKGDRRLLRIAVLNVLHNALKFSPRGSILRISYSLDQSDHPTLLVAIQDEGPGIQRGDHEKIFERFFTSSTPLTASQSGTGLGLSIAKLIIVRMGGTIRFDTEVQGGARCLIELPTGE
jgi:signal transduction histidine kinase